MFSYEMPTKLYFGKGCVAEAGDDVKALGSKVLLVTGRRSAKQNGSQAAVVSLLESLGIEWVLFDDVEANPSVETVRKGAALGRQEGVDFVVGIGGGSPMDAAKVIALLCTNELDDTARMNWMTRPCSKARIKRRCRSSPCLRRRVPAAR